MAHELVIALDAMGGDRGPEVVVPGAAISLLRHPGMRFRLFGDRALIEPLLDRHAALKAASEIVHTDVQVAMDDKPSQALKRGRGRSSMWLAIDAVKTGTANVAVSGGNTGALMAMSKICLKTLAGIDRPVICGIWPTVTSECLVLDLGANVGANAHQLMDSAFMGAAMSRVLFGIERPSVGLLNIGVEEMKGLDEIKSAHTWLRDHEQTLPFRYQGFVEGDRIGHGGADVVVTDGFTGNIALKTAEGTARQLAQYLREAMNRSPLTRAGAFLAQGAFHILKQKMDPRRLNGGVFLGLNGLVIKSHGGTDETGFASAIDLGYDIARADLVSRIAADLQGVDMSAVGSTESEKG
ncbi:MAG: phosphate acyltransferase PlsX [Hyphomicrobiaceae bacterium]